MGFTFGLELAKAVYVSHLNSTGNTAVIRVRNLDKGVQWPEERFLQGDSGIPGQQVHTSTLTSAPMTDSVSVGLPGIRKSHSIMVPSFAPATNTCYIYIEASQACPGQDEGCVRARSLLATFQNLRAIPDARISLHTG